MLVTAPPGTGYRASLARPGLIWARHLAMGPRDRRVAYDHGHRRVTLRYLADMLRPYGVPYSETYFESGNQNSFAFLAERLLGHLAGQEPPDVIVVAHSAPDCEPGRSLSGHLTTLLPNEPLCFAVSDQEGLSPFSALNAIRGLAAPGWRRALMLVLDQSTLPYAPQLEPAGRTAPADHVVGLLFSADAAVPGWSLSALRQRQQVPPEAVHSTLAEIAAELPPGPGPAGPSPADPVTVLAGPGISAACLPPRLWGAEASDAGELLTAPPSGPPCVAAWAALARVFGSAQAGRVIVTQYDPALSGLGVAVLDPVPPAVRAGRSLEATA